MGEMSCAEEICTTDPHCVQNCALTQGIIGPRTLSRESNNARGYENKPLNLEKVRILCS